MPPWFVDIGRWVGGLLVFGMCAAFTSAALVPCWFAFVTLHQRTSTLWAVLSVPFLYGVWGWGYCLLCVIYKNLCYRPREGEYPLFSWPTVGWGTTGALTNWANVLFLQHWKGTPFLNLYLRAMGAKVGRRASINTIHIYDWDLITIGDNAVLGGDCVVQAHLLEGGRMKMRATTIGADALIGTGARVMPGCIVQERGVLAAGSIMKKASVVEANTIYGGAPAKLIRARGAAEVDDSGVKRAG
jgi:non-ribosomal peptide synthetase-like protein